MPQTLAQTIRGNIETVRKDVLPNIFRVDDQYVTSRLIGKMEKYRITKTQNGLDFRAPLKMQPSGRYSFANYAGGSLGTGGKADIEQLYQTYFPQKLVYQLDFQAIVGTKQSELARYNAWKDSMKEAIELAQRYLDVGFHTIGGSQGVIMQAAGWDGTSVMTAAASNMADLMLIGQTVEIWDTTLTTNRTSGLSGDSLPVVANVAPDQSYVTLGNLGSVSGITGTDKLLLPGQGVTPSGPNGLQYFNDTSTANSVLGLSKTTYPDMAASGFPANGATYQVAFALRCRHQIEQRRGDVSKLIGLMPLAQSAAINLSVSTQATFLRTKPTENMIDPLLQIGDSQPWGGILHIPDLHQARDRVDYVMEGNWGMVYLNDSAPDFYKAPGSNEIFFSPVSTTDGTPLFSSLFAIIWENNWYNVDPGRSAVVTGLQKPAGY